MSNTRSNRRASTLRPDEARLRNRAMVNEPPPQRRILHRGGRNHFPCRLFHLPLRALLLPLFPKTRLFFSRTRVYTLKVSFTSAASANQLNSLKIHLLTAEASGGKTPHAPDNHLFYISLHRFFASTPCSEAFSAANCGSERKQSVWCCLHYPRLIFNRL